MASAILFKWIVFTSLLTYCSANNSTSNVVDASSVRPSSTVNSASIDPTGSAPQSSAVSATSINPARSVPVVASSTASPGQRSKLYNVFPGVVNSSAHKEYEYEGYDGWYNNRAHPEWGAVDSPLTRRVPSHYSDGVYSPSGNDRPNPLSLSQKLMSGDTGKGSSKNKSALLVFFGQQVVEEILDAQRPGCPPEYFNIPIPENYTLYKGLPEAIPFLRSRYDMGTGYSPNNPRQQLNEITPWIDGGLTYGVAKAWADALRSFKDGKLAKSEKGNWPEENELGLPMANPPLPSVHQLRKVSRFFKLGNPRGNENPFLLTFGILWFRFHNIMAERIKNRTDITDDEKLFNEARKWVIAVHQKIVFYDWLPRFLGENPTTFAEENEYKYQPAMHPGIAHVFQSAAMRFGHTMVTPGVMRSHPGCKKIRTTKDSGALGEKAANKSGVRTCNAFWNPQQSIQEKGENGKLLDIEAYLRGMAAQTAEREDNIITEDLRGFVFGSLDFSRRDLMAVNIQRGRDHGLPDYNTARVAYGLKKKEHFMDIKAKESSIDNEIFTELQNLTKGDISKIDVWVGGLLETSNSGPGELFSTIIKDQFLRIRGGDRFWFENDGNGHFTDEELAEIKSITLRDVILMSTDVKEGDLPDDVFFVNGSCNFGTLKQTDMEECSDPQTFDYFEGSEVSFALTFLAAALFCVGIVGLMFCLAHRRQKVLAEKRKLQRRKTRRTSKADEGTFVAAEWRRNLPDRDVKVKLGPTKMIRVSSGRGQLLRTIDLRGMEWIILFLQNDREETLLSARMDREYDLIVKFDTKEQREEFIVAFESFLKQHEIKCTKNEMKTQMLISSAHTKEDRQKRLEKFFRVAFAHAFDIEYQDQDFGERMGAAKEVLSCELSKTEFAEALSLKPNSLFVEQMFDLVDKDQNGYLSFREFLDVIVIFAKGSPDDKLRLFFDMYDVSGNQKLGRDEFKQMIKSFMELVNADVETGQLDALTDSMFSEAGYTSKSELTFDDFKTVMAEYKENLEDAQLNLEGTGVDVPKGATNDKKEQKTVIKRENVPSRARKTMMRAFSNTPTAARSPARSPTAKVKVTTKKTKDYDNIVVKNWIAFARYVSNNISKIFITVLYTLVLFAIFAERSYYYSVEREHAGLRRIAGYGVTVTRGAASAMMFTYSSLVVTMCRNLITFLRETFVGHYVPFDSNVLIHKYIAFWALIFTIMHAIGHAINFYHVATQPANDLTCLFRNYFHSSSELPKFHYWCWETITGLTGIMLLCVVVVIYVFASQYSRRHVFVSFWRTHQLYVVLYLLMVLHGSGNLVQRPFFHYFFLGPGILFALDKLVSMSRKKADIAVMKAELLPSDITHLEFKRPTNFEYKAGQWCRIACVSLGGGEYHPFTLTSAPHEDNLSLHIRAVGPWTINLRQVYDPSNLQPQKAYPQLYLDGPFGEGHQDWYRYEVSVLVGGGIGVTPFASILKDIAHKGNIKSTFACKKVYFIWVTRTQKHFEWLTDIIREVEEKDGNDLVSVHIFVTQFYHKFDLRTTMLYICERHFQKISGRSLFTGLRSITHFGRPDFHSFLESLSTTIHPTASKIGVFSCGPPAMTRGVESACGELNKTEGAAFIHHFENF